MSAVVLSVAAAKLTPSGPVVYRLLGVAGELLYVGCSGNLAKRLAGHRSKPWWPEVRSVAVQAFGSLRDAASAEADAIASESPRENVRARRERLTPEELAEFLARQRAERVAAGLPERVTDAAALQRVADVVLSQRYRTPRTKTAAGTTSAAVQEVDRVCSTAAPTTV